MFPENNRDNSKLLADALEGMILALPRVRRILKADEDLADSSESNWHLNLERGVIPRLRSDLPLLVGLCGGGNVGKSTLFNALAGLSRQVGSPAGAYPGLTRRALLAIPRPSYGPDLLSALFQRFGWRPEPYDFSQTPMTEPGPPLFILTDSGPPDTILVDQPDMDTANAKDYDQNDRGYANRELSRKILAACDLMVFIAGNMNYSNKNIADFMRETVFANGERPAMLVYRYAFNIDADNRIWREQAEHIRSSFATMSSLLYPDVDPPPLHGCFLMREETDVQNTSRPNLVRFSADADSPIIQPHSGVDILRGALARIDRNVLYRETVRKVVGTALEKASHTLESYQKEKGEIERFHAELEKATEHIAGSSLFPTLRLQRELDACWREEQHPIHRFIALPGRGLSKAVTKTRSVAEKVAGRIPILKNSLFNTPPGQSNTEHEQMKKGCTKFINECSEFRKLLIEDKLKAPAENRLKTPRGEGPGNYQYVPVPKLYRQCQKSLDFQAFEGKCTDDLSQAWCSAFDLPPDIREVIRPYVREARKHMSAFERRQEGGKTALNAFCQLAAVVYVVGTGGATLWWTGGSDALAFAALPALWGLDHMPEQWRRKIWADIIRKWHDERIPPMIKVIQENITGAFLQAGAEAVNLLEEPLGQAMAARAEAEGLFAEWSKASEESDPERNPGHDCS